VIHERITGESLVPARSEDIDAGVQNAEGEYLG
jgi:hypothetical protein